MADDNDCLAPASDEEADGADGSESDDRGANAGGNANNKMLFKKSKTKPGG